MAKKILITLPEISMEEQKRYAGKDVAIVDEKIVASGETSKEAFEKAKRLFPNKRSEEIGLLYIPKGEVLIL